MEGSISLRARVRAIRARATYAKLAMGSVVVGALMAPSVASAQSPTDAQYDPSIEVITQTGSGGDGGTLGALPFTGLDLALLAAVAVGLGIAGLVLRRRTGDEEPEGITR